MDDVVILERMRVGRLDTTGSALVESFLTHSFQPINRYTTLMWYRCNGVNYYTKKYKTYNNPSSAPIYTET